MATKQASSVLQLIHKMESEYDDSRSSDRELLLRFAEQRDEKAFAVLVRRYGPMTLGVAQRVLRQYQDAEDVCQATFLLLAQKARNANWRDSVANWLYEAAYRLALKARDKTQRRTIREARVQPKEPLDAMAEITLRDLQAAIDAELTRMPQKYRIPLQLCCLEGKSRDEAANYLGLPLPTVKSRLEEGREQLRRRLARRGIPLSIAMAGVTLFSANARAIVPAAFINRVSRAAVKTVSGQTLSHLSSTVSDLIQEGVLWMSTSKFKPILLLFLTICIGAGLASQSLSNPANSDAGVPPLETPAADDDNPLGGTRCPTAISNAAVDGVKKENVNRLVQEKTGIFVVDTDDKPVAGATIRMLTWDKSQSLVEKVVGKTGDNGRFAVECVPPCQFTVDAGDRGMAWTDRETRGRELKLKLARPLPIKGWLADLQGKPLAGVKVRVESIGKPVNDDLTAVYNAFRADPGILDMFLAQLSGSATGSPQATVTDNDGQFELKNVGTDRVVRIRFLADGIESTLIHIVADLEFSNRMKQPTAAEKNKNFFFKQHKPAVYGPEFKHAARPEHIIEGSVCDDVTGKPLPGISIWGTLRPIGMGASLLSFGDSWLGKANAKTDDKGRFKLTGLPKALDFGGKEPQRYLMIRTEGAPYLDTIVTLPDSADYAPQTVNVKLRPAVTITGQILNKATGKPVQGVARWFALAANEMLANGIVNGDELSLLYGRRYSGALPSAIDLPTDEYGRFRLQVPGGPGVILVEAAHEPANWFTPAFVRDADKQYLAKARPGGRMTDLKDGNDDYFAVHGPRWPIRWANEYAIINPGEKESSVEMQLALNTGSSVKLIVSDPDGKPLKGVTLVSEDLRGQILPTFATDEIVIGGLIPNNRLRQVFLLHRERGLCAELTVKGDEKKPIAVTLHPCATVTGKVEDEVGNPVKNADVRFQMKERAADSLLRQKLFRDSDKTTTDGDGKFTFLLMFPERELMLIATQQGLINTAAVMDVKLKAGETKDVGTLRLKNSD